MALTATYVSVFKVWGISKLPEPIELTPPESRVRVALSSDIEEHLLAAAKRFGLGNTILDAIFGGATKYTSLPFAERFEKQTADEKARLEEIAGRGTFIILESLDDVPNAGERTQRDGIDIIWDAFPPGHFSTSNKPITDQVISAVLGSLPSGYCTDVSQVFDYAIMHEDDGRVVYPITISGGGTAVVSRSPDSGFSQRVRDQFRTLTADPTTNTPARLLAESAINHNDNLHSFILGWASLEILIQKLFSYYRIWDIKLGHSLPPHASRYFESTKKILDSRLNLLDRFVVVAEILAPSDAAADIITFKELKQQRDAFFHSPGGAIPTSAAARNLSSKYIALHLAEIARGKDTADQA